MAPKSAPKAQANAFDQPHHPGNPKFNFVPLYITIIAIAVLSISVKIMTGVLKKRRDKKRDPDVELQNLDLHERMWFPWRYDKYGRKKTSPGMSHDASYGGTSSGTASPVLMSGALSPNSLPPPIRMDTLSSGMTRSSFAGSASNYSEQNPNFGATARSTYIGDSNTSSTSDSSRLPSVNPFTSKPFRSPTLGSDSNWTATNRCEPKDLGGYGGLGPLPDPIVYDKSNNGRSDKYQRDGGYPDHEEQLFEPPFAPYAPLESGIENQDFAHGYGASTTASRTASTQDKTLTSMLTKQTPDTKGPPSRNLTAFQSSSSPSSQSSATTSSRNTPSSSPCAGASPPSRTAGGPPSSRGALSSSSSSSTPSSSSRRGGVASSSSGTTAARKGASSLGTAKFKGVVVGLEDKAAHGKSNKGRTESEAKKNRAAGRKKK